MNVKKTLFSLAVLALACQNVEGQSQIGLKDVVKDKFLMGVAVNVPQTEGQEPKATEIIARHFNSVVAENCMKCEVVHP